MNLQVVLPGGIEVPAYVRMCDNLFCARDVVIWGNGSSANNVNFKMNTLAEKDPWVKDGNMKVFYDANGKTNSVKMRAYTVDEVLKVMMLLDGTVIGGVPTQGGKILFKHS